MKKYFRFIKTDIKELAHGWIIWAVILLVAVFSIFISYNQIFNYDPLSFLLNSSRMGVFIIALILGAGILSDDIKKGLAGLYLSRSITRKTFIYMKFTARAFSLFAFWFLNEIVLAIILIYTEGYEHLLVFIEASFSSYLRGLFVLSILMFLSLLIPGKLNSVVYLLFLVLYEFGMGKLNKMLGTSEFAANTVHFLSTDPFHWLEIYIRRGSFSWTHLMFGLAYISFFLLLTVVVFNRLELGEKAL